MAEGIDKRSFIVVTNHQKSGRGRRTNKWQSESGKDLTFSIAISDMGFPIEEKFLLTKLSSLAIIRSFQKLRPGKEWQIKWPNDIFFKGQKVGGILIENYLQGNKIESSIIGIGLNINSLDHVLGRTSIVKILENEAERVSILRDVCSTFFEGLMNLTPDFKQELHSFYLGHLFGIGCWVEMNFESKKTGGIFKGVEPGGELVLEQKGSITKFSPDSVFGLNFTVKKIQ